MPAVLTMQRCVMAPRVATRLPGLYSELIELYPGVKLRLIQGLKLGLIDLSLSFRN